MSKPYLTLEKWLSTDTELKKKFLVDELARQDRFIDCEIGIDNKINKITSINSKIPQEQAPEQLLSFHLDDIPFILHPYIFNKLKNRFRSFKYKQLNKKNNRITKQIVLDQNILNKLEKITEEKNLKSLQNCLEYLINEQNFNVKAKDKEIQNLKEEHKSRKNKNISLEQQLTRQKELTKISKENTDKATKEFENHLIKTALDAKLELEKYKTFLGELSETEVKTINDSLSNQELNKIESQFEKDCAHKKQTLYKLHESYTNDALGFNHHEPLL